MTGSFVTWCGKCHQAFKSAQDFSEHDCAIGPEEAREKRARQDDLDELTRQSERVEGGYR